MLTSKGSGVSGGYLINIDDVGQKVVKSEDGLHSILEPRLKGNVSIELTEAFSKTY